MIRGWDQIALGCGKTSQRCPDGNLLPRAGSMSPTNQKSARGVGFSTPCEAVSPQRMFVFVPGLLEL